MEAEAYDSVGTLPDALAYEVVVQVFYRAVGCAEFDHFLIRLSLALVHLSLIQRMSIVDFASIVLQVSCCCLWLGLVSDRIHYSCLDTRRVKDYSTFNILFSLFEVLPPSTANSANVRHILRPIHFIRILILYVARLSFPDTHTLMTIFLLDYDIFLASVDVLIVWTSRKWLLLVALNIGGSLALVML